MTRWLIGVSVSCLSVFGAAAQAAEGAAADRPNVVVFLVDDMGLMDTSVPFVVGADGEPEAQALNGVYRTPAMERLAAQGVRLTQFYAMSVCSPTRTSIITGQNAARHGVTQWIRSEGNNRGEFGPFDWNWTGVSPEDVTLPGVLSDAGYRTIFVGKAHFGPNDEPSEWPDRIGFDVNIAGCSWGQPGSYRGEDGYGHLAGNASRAVPHLEAYHGTDTHLSEALTIEANRAVTEAVEAGEPFFLYFGHYAVHTPFQVDPRFAGHYEGVTLNGEALTDRMVAYTTLIEGMDESLGQVLDHLEALGVAEDTLIIFLGDNGGDAPLGNAHQWTSSAPFRGKKGTHYEGGMRVPFIAAWGAPDEGNALQRRWPIAVEGVQQQLGAVTDLFPTVLELAGVATPEGHAVDGHSLWTQLAGGESDRPERFLMHFPHDHRSSYFTSFRDGDWKVVYHNRPGANPANTRYELFNLATDPYERENVAAGEPAKLREMVEAMVEQLEAEGALWPVDGEGDEVRPVVP